jgi:hypothetical protein
MDWLMWGCEFQGDIQVELELDALAHSIEEELLNDLGALLARLIKLREKLEGTGSRSL